MADYTQKYDEFQKENATYSEEIAVFDDKYKIWKQWNDSQDDTAESENKEDEPENPVEPDEPAEFDLEKPKQPIVSIYEKGSVGKIYFQFAKTQEARWTRLYNLEFGQKVKAQIWWEEYAKYENELVILDPWEDDDDNLLDKVANSKKPWL